MELNKKIMELTKELKLSTISEEYHNIATIAAIKTVDQFDYTFSVGVNRKQIEELANLSFIKKHENIVLLGQCGVGKIHLADVRINLYHSLLFG